MRKLLFLFSVLTLLTIAACKKDYPTIDKGKIDDYVTSKGFTTQSTASGVQYIIEKEGKGENIKETDEVAVRYKGYFLDDKQFDKADSTIFYLDGVIQGWRDGIQQFKVGGKGKLFIPSELAFGATGLTFNGQQIIPKNQVLVYDIEVLKKNPIYDRNIKDMREFIKSKGWKADSLASGLFYVIDQPGTGANPTASSSVTVKYKGYTLDGKVFDQNDNATFSLSKVIQGWQVGIPLFKQGGKGKLIMPSRMGYYASGTGAGGIPPYAPLVFEIELNSF